MNNTPAKKPFDAKMLKLCPFCKGHPDYIDYEGMPENYDPDVSCNNGDCPINGVAMSIDEWNNRTDIPRQDVDALIEAIRKVVEDGVQETEGQYSSHKNNKCRHGQFGYEGCDQCICEFLEKTLSEFQSKHPK